jgi:hypothetical protein
MSDSANSFGSVIFTYSRAQALADGVLVDLTQIETIRTAFKYPVACTDTVWALIAESLTHDGQDIEGLGHDISTMAEVMKQNGHSVHEEAVAESLLADLSRDEN